MDVLLGAEESSAEFYNQLSLWMTEDPPTTPAYTETTNNSTFECLEHLILMMEAKLMKKFDDMESKLNSFSLKQMKRKRTGTNRCKNLNRKGEMCNGYVCKNKSKYLCYAHYVLMDKKKEEAGYLYSKKNTFK
jgi:hypothetical protein